LPHEGPVNLGQMMLSFAALGAASQVILLRVVPRRA